MSDPLAITTRSRVVLALLAFVGATLILISTSHYGAGLSPDSVGYISIARSLIAGSGVTLYDGTPNTVQPPLYPALLALFALICSTDPLQITHVVNAIVFGLVVYFAGLLAFKLLSGYPFFAILATLTILASRPLLIVSTMAWSEPLFILFVLLSLVFMDSYLAKQDTVSLIGLSVAVALSCLTRYIGVTLILWGVLILVAFAHDNLKRKIAHIFAFAFVSVVPLGIWIMRNYTISGTFLGPRYPSEFTLSQNIAFVFNTIWIWYVCPTKLYSYVHSNIQGFNYLLKVLGSALGFMVVINLIKSQSVKISIRRIVPLALFVAIYTAFLVISSTTTAYNKISHRLLSPIYVPLTLFLFMSVVALLETWKIRFPKINAEAFLTVIIAICLICPISNAINKAAYLNRNGQGCSSKEWINGETIQYIRQHQTLGYEGDVYSNAPDTIYILTDIAAKMSPYIREASDIAKYKGAWPTTDQATLIWFDRKDCRPYLTTVDKLQAVANIRLIKALKDGAVYSVTRK